MSVLEIKWVTARLAEAENPSFRIYFRYESKLTEALCFTILYNEQSAFFSDVKHTLNCRFARLDSFQRSGIQDQSVIRSDPIKQVVNPLISEALLNCDLMVLI